MRPKVVVVVKVGRQLLVELLAIRGRIQVDAFPLDASPKLLDEGVVGGPALAAPADLKAQRLQGAHKLAAGKLAVLVGIEDPGHAVQAAGLVHGPQAEVDRQGVADLPTQHEMAKPVHDGYQIQKAAL